MVEFSLYHKVSSLYHTERPYGGEKGLNRLARDVAHDEDDARGAVGVEAVSSTPEQFGSFIRVEMDKYTRLIKETNIKVNP